MESTSLEGRIIPITILNTPHRREDTNGNKRHSASSATLPSTSDTSLSTEPKRKSLLVTLDDGTTTETQGFVTNLPDSATATKSSPLSEGRKDSTNNFFIQEIGQDTLQRELSRDRQKNSPGKSVRFVPIKLTDGKVQQQESDETMQIHTEFTNYSHQEFPNANEEEEIPRFDSSSSNTQRDKQPAKKERVIPIQLASGESIMPSFTKLEDPKPPDWSTFSAKNKLKENIVPLHVEDFDDRYHRGSRDRANKSQENSRNRKHSGEKKPLHSVRFDLQDEKLTEKTERRSSSVETYTRKTTTSKSSKPPTVGGSPRILKDRPKYSQDPFWRPASADQGKRDAALSPNTERTLQEIDRDINKIWKELQELEQFPTSKSSQQQKKSSSPVPVTPVRVRAFNTATPQSASPSQKWSTTKDSSEPKVTFSDPSSSSTPATERRTIWDMEPSPVGRFSRESSPRLQSASPAFQPRGRRNREATKPGSIHPSWRSSSASRAMPGAATPLASSTVTGAIISNGSRRPPPPPYISPPPIINSRESTTVCKAAPIAKDESFYDLDQSSSSPFGSSYDNNPPVIRKSSVDGKGKSPSPTKTENNNFSLLVDKATQTAEAKRKSNGTCIIL